MKTGFGGQINTPMAPFFSAVGVPTLPSRGKDFLYSVSNMDLRAINCKGFIIDLLVYFKNCNCNFF